MIFSLGLAISKALNSPGLLGFGIRICLTELNLNLPSCRSTMVLLNYSRFKLLLKSMTSLVPGVILSGLLFINK